MAEAFFFLTVTIALGAFLLYAAVQLRSHALWRYKILVAFLVLLGGTVSSWGFVEFFGRLKDEKELIALREKAAALERAEFAQNKNAVRTVPALEVRVDSGTGCQYLVAPNNSLLPRLDSTGRQICKELK